MNSLVFRPGLFVLAVACLLSACATATMDAQTKASVRRVYVEPVQPAKPSVAPERGGGLDLVSGRAAPAPAQAAERFNEIVQTKVGLPSLLEAQARKELVAKGYVLAASPAESDATLRFIVYHGLGVTGALSSGRGISMTVNMEMVHASNNKRFLFGIANQVQEPRAAQIKSAPYADWFSNDALVVEQYRIVSEALVSQVLAGL